MQILPARLTLTVMSIVAVVLALLAAPAAAPASAGSEQSLIISTVSNRADLISGGQALVEVTTADGAAPTGLTVSLDGVDVTPAFALREATGTVQGLVTGLDVGENVLVADAADGAAAQLVITNHPQGGPIFSGLQVQPWACNTHGAGEPIDAQCNVAEPHRVWKYRTNEGTTVEFDPANPPDPEDVQDLTNSLGETGEFMYVVETGMLNRGAYRMAIFAHPDEVSPWTPSSAWNGSLYHKYGASCGTTYGSGGFIEGVEDNRALNAGYGIITHSLNVLGNNCNTVTSAESSMMMLEHIRETFGPITHIRGKGGSGGSIGQHVVASGYPGLLDGLNVDLSYEDFWTTHKEVADCKLLQNYFRTTSPHLWADVTAQGKVMGHQSISSCAVWEASFFPLLDPTTGCGAGAAYHPADNPTGCRATVQDMQVNVLGRRPAEKWTDAERAAGYGFAELPYDNTGMLYGLRALQAGDITPEQFVDLNEKVGGLDIDGGFQPDRTDADPAVVETLYRGGMVASGETLSEVPIIDIRYFAGNAEIHTNFHSYAMAQRLVNAQGHHDNQSIWKLFEVPNLPSIAGPQSFGEMTSWLNGIDADTSDRPIQDKIADAMPEGAGDSCIIQDQRSQDLTACSWFSYYGNALIAAGGPLSNDVLKCTTRPLPIEWPADGTFGQIPFTPSVAGVAGQWERLLDAFPDGVCDWSVPGVGQVPVQPWTTFAAGPGGQPLGDPPVSSTIG